MALLARRGEARRNVIGILGGIEVLLMAGSASSRGPLVLSVQVALRAKKRLVRASQCESGGGVVELCACPGSCVVALRTRLREPGGDVIGILRGSKVIPMTADAIG